MFQPQEIEMCAMLGNAGQGNAIRLYRQESMMMSQQLLLTRKVVRMLKCFFMSVPNTSLAKTHRHGSICSRDKAYISSDHSLMRQSAARQCPVRVVVMSHPAEAFTTVVVCVWARACVHV
jgi:hypothetical protein